MIQESNLQLNVDAQNYQFPTLYPKEIYDLLSKEVIGQDSAKKAIAVAAFMHMQRIKTGIGEKSNVLLVGPTGCGKTLMIKTLANALKLPVAIIDATTLTEVGYVGEDPGDAIATKLYNAANKDPILAEHGVVFIDEIDKIAKSDTVQVSRIGVQRSLLTILEDTTLTVSPKLHMKHMQSEQISIRTKNILFICSGAFVGIEKVAYKNRGGPKLGFCKDDSASISSKELIHQDFVNYGLMEELVARLPIIAVMSALTATELEQMMHFSESSPLNKYKRILSRLTIDLDVTKQAVNAIAQKAIQSGTGARGVKIHLESLLSQAIFDINKKRHNSVIEINEKTVSGQEDIKIVQKKEA